MAPYDFQASGADAVLRSSNGKEIRVHKIILSFASPVFQGMFGLPQPTGSLPQIPTIDVTEFSGILEPFIQYIYPCSPPKVSDVAMWSALYTVADKYQAEGVMDSLRDILLPKFLETSPLRVYALASRWGLKEEAKTASAKTLTIDIRKDFPREDAEMMGGVACQQLYLFHLTRQEAAQTQITKQPHLPPTDKICKCSGSPPSNFIPALCRRVGARPSLTLEEVYEEAFRCVWPETCYGGCRFSFKNLHQYFRSLATTKGASQPP